MIPEYLKWCIHQPIEDKLFGITIRKCWGFCTTSGHCEWNMGFLITLFAIIDFLLILLIIYLSRKGKI